MKTLEYFKDKNKAFTEPLYSKKYWLYERDDKRIGVNKAISLCKCKKELRKLLENYIKIEKFDKPNLHFKNNSEYGKLFQSFCDYKLNRSQYFGDGSTPKHFLSREDKGLSDYLWIGKTYYDIKDEEYLINMYLSKFYKKDVIFNHEVYNDFLNMVEFVKSYTDNENKLFIKRKVTGRISSILEKEKVAKCLFFDGEIDYHSKNKIFELKCSSKITYTSAIEQCLSYACILIEEISRYGLEGYDIKEIGIINTILGTYCHMNLDEFGQDNLEKFCELIFREVV